jgi:hypothetical protein
MLHVDAIPITGFKKSLSLKPTALSMERLGALSAPSTTIEEYFRNLSGLPAGSGIFFNTSLLSKLSRRLNYYQRNLFLCQF